MLTPLGNPRLERQFGWNSYQLLTVMIEEFWTKFQVLTPHLWLKIGIIENLISQDSFIQFAQTWMDDGLWRGQSPTSFLSESHGFFFAKCLVESFNASFQYNLHNFCRFFGRGQCFKKIKSCVFEGSVAG